jgi:hypothetical protein
MKLLIYQPNGDFKAYEPEIGVKWPVISLLHIPNFCEYRLLYPRLVADEIDRYNTATGTLADS